MKLSFYPTTLDVLKDLPGDKYVQFFAWPISGPVHPEVYLTCKDLATEKLVRYEVTEYDVVEMPKKEVKEVLPTDLLSKVYRVDEGICLTGKIVKRK